MDLRERERLDNAQTDVGSAARAPSPRRHPWESARADFVRALLVQHAPAARRLLDIGAGDAFVAHTLVQSNSTLHITAVDASFSESDVQRFSSMQVSCRKDLPTASAEFDVALLLDVLEHVKDDRALLQDARARLRVGGTVIVTVPAWPQLFSSHDVHLAHERRYTTKQLRALVARSGLECVACGGLFTSLLAPRIAQVVMEKLAPRPRAAQAVEVWRGGALTTAAVTAALRIDSYAARVFATAHVPLAGLSAFAVCRRGVDA